MVFFLDDEPDDGPHHYVMVFGQTDALLVQALSDIGVYVDTILCMKTDAYEGYDADQAEKSQESKPDEKFEEQLTKAQMAVIAREFMAIKKTICCLQFRKVFIFHRSFIFMMEK